jgi:hypothetical protein
MARKKDPPKPLLSMKHDFYASLDNVIQEATMLISALDTVISHGNLSPRINDVLIERVAALRGAIFTEG